MLWLNKNKHKISNDISESEKLNIEDGHVVGNLATQHSAYSNGCLIESLDVKKSLIETEIARKSKKYLNYYEAAFSYNYDKDFDLFIRVDILKEINEFEFELTEVKSSSSEQEIHYWDIAFQYYVLIKNGITLNNAWLLKPNKEYIRETEQLDIEKFFLRINIHEMILKEYLPRIEGFLIELKNSMLNKNEPLVKTGTHCKTPWVCPNYQYCNKNINVDSIENLTRLSDDKRNYLLNNGVKYINQINDKVVEKYLNESKKKLLSDKQEIQVWSAINNKVFINENEIKLFLSQLTYPLFYLDFEAFNSAIPQYIGMKPHQFLTFQASIHKEDSINNLIHYEFIQESSEDPRKKIINFLIDKLESNGSIIVYNKSFEETRIKELSTNFPEYSNKLMDLINRMVDLEVPFKKHYYSHEFMGSSSIKKVLPVVVPELSYDRLEIKNGADAQAIFRKYINNKEQLNENEFDVIKKNLLEYCKLDTFAMVMLLKNLKNSLTKT